MPDQQHKRGFLIEFNEFEKGRTFWDCAESRSITVCSSAAYSANR